MSRGEAGDADGLPPEVVARLRAYAAGREVTPGAALAELCAAADHTCAVALAGTEARAHRLEAALAEARRPWLAKVLEGLRRKES